MLEHILWFLSGSSEMTKDHGCELHAEGASLAASMHLSRSFLSTGIWEYLLVLVLFFTRSKNNMPAPFSSSDLNKSRFPSWSSVDEIEANCYENYPKKIVHDHRQPGVFVHIHEP